MDLQQLPSASWAGIIARVASGGVRDRSGRCRHGNVPDGGGVNRPLGWD